MAVQASCRNRRHRRGSREPRIQPGVAIVVPTWEQTHLNVTFKKNLKSCQSEIWFEVNAQTKTLTSKPPPINQAMDIKLNRATEDMHRKKNKTKPTDKLGLPLTSDYWRANSALGVGNTALWKGFRDRQRNAYIHASSYTLTPEAEVETYGQIWRLFEQMRSIRFSSSRHRYRLYKLWLRFYNSPPVRKAWPSRVSMSIPSQRTISGHQRLSRPYPSSLRNLLLAIFTSNKSELLHP